MNNCDQQKELQSGCKPTSSKAKGKGLTTKHYQTIKLTSSNTTERTPLRVVALSDTYSQHHEIKTVPDGDVFIHCGDFTNKGTEKKVKSFFFFPFFFVIFVLQNTFC